jgi:transcription antitermination factor NusG
MCLLNTTENYINYSLMQNWYVVYTQAESEQKVAEALWRKNIENYYPITTVIRKIGGINRELLRPLFYSYVFVRTTEDELWKLKDVKRIMNIMYWLSKPAIIPNEEIEMVKRFTREHKCVRAERTESNPKEIGKIVQEQITVKENDSFATLFYDIRLLLPNLGYTLVAPTGSGEITFISDKANFYNFAQKS